MHVRTEEMCMFVNAKPFLWRFQMTMGRRLRSRRGRRRFVGKTEAAVCRNPLGRPCRTAPACRAHHRSWPSPHSCRKPVKKQHLPCQLLFWVVSLHHLPWEHTRRGICLLCRRWGDRSFRRLRRRPPRTWSSASSRQTNVVSVTNWIWRSHSAERFRSLSLPRNCCGSVGLASEQLWSQAEGSGEAFSVLLESCPDLRQRQIHSVIIFLLTLHCRERALDAAAHPAHSLLKRYSLKDHAEIRLLELSNVLN